MNSQSRNTNRYFLLIATVIIIPVLISLFPYFLENTIQENSNVRTALMLYDWLAGFALIVLGACAYLLAQKEKSPVWVAIVILVLGLLWSAFIVKEVFLAEL